MPACAATGRFYPRRGARDATDAERETHWPRVKALFPAYDYFQTTTPRKFGLVFITPTGPA